jgi:hypothetical protein
LQKLCKWSYLLIGAFLKVSGDLLGLLHGCCTHCLLCSESVNHTASTPAT